jgi:SEC-C motif-containing protein
MDNTGMVACPCGTRLPYDECCGRFHRGEAAAPTAEALMRSRYSAYAERDAAYLLRTWHRRTRPRTVAFGEETRWTGLEITGGSGGALFDAAGTVTFRAHFTESGHPGVMVETSSFVRENGVWFYVDAV